MSNIISLVIDGNGVIKGKVNGFVTAHSNNSIILQVIAPFPSTDSVYANFYLRNSRQDNYTHYLKLLKDSSGNVVLGKDEINPDRDYYQEAREWNVWQIPLNDKVLKAISKYHSGKIDVSISFREYKSFDIDENMTYKGTFGTKKTTVHHLPLTATEGDYYECQNIDFYDSTSEKIYTIRDLAIYRNGEWVKGDVYITHLSIPSTEIGVESAIPVEDIRTIDDTIGDRILSRVNDLESIVIGEQTLTDFSTMYSRTDIDLNYDNVSDHNDNDYLYIERDRDGKAITKYDFLNNVTEISSNILRTNSAISYDSGFGIYADDTHVLLGSATGAGFTLDRNSGDIEARSLKIVSGQITDQNLLEQLKGDPGDVGPEGPQGPEGPEGPQGPDGIGIPIKPKGTLSYLSDLSIISGQELNDQYYIIETGEQYVWDGTQWVNMGVIKGEQGPQGPEGPEGPQGQDGLPGEDAKYIKVTGEQQFNYPADSTIPENTSITINAELFGGLTDYLWQYFNGDIWVDLSGTNNTSSYTLNYNQSEWTNPRKLIIRCVSGIHYDVINIVKLYDGDNGVDGISNIYGYLTDTNIVIPSNYDGSLYDLSDYDLATSTIYLKMFYGTTDVSDSATYSIETSGTTNQTKNGLSISINQVGRVYIFSDIDWTTDSETFTIIGEYEGVSIEIKLKVVKAKEGRPGYGFNFKGIYDSSKTYTFDTIRRDAVEYEGQKYTVKNFGEFVSGTWDPSKWMLATEIEFIATDLLLAQDATITKGLVMGDINNKGYISSYDPDSGFLLNGDGSFRFGNVNGNNIDWDNSSLNITVGENNLETSKVKNILDSNGFSIIDVSTNKATSWFSKDGARIKTLQVEDIKSDGEIFKKVYNGDSVTYYVGPNSTGDGSGRDSSNLCSSINDALNNATNGCKILNGDVTITIVIYAGEYNETLNISGYSGGNIIFEFTPDTGIIVINSDTNHIMQNNNTHIEFNGLHSTKTHFLMTSTDVDCFNIYNSSTLYFYKCSFIGGKTTNTTADAIKSKNSSILVQFCNFVNFHRCIYSTFGSTITTYDLKGDNIDRVLDAEYHSQIYYEGTFPIYGYTEPIDRGVGGLIQVLSGSPGVYVQKAAENDQSVFSTVSSTIITKRYYGETSISYFIDYSEVVEYNGTGGDTIYGRCEALCHEEYSVRGDYTLYNTKIGYLKFNRSKIYSDVNAVNNGYNNTISSGKLKIYYTDENVPNITDNDNAVNIVFVENNDTISLFDTLPGGSVTEYSQEFTLPSNMLDYLENASSGDITFRIEILYNPSWISLNIDKCYIELDIGVWL